MQSAKREEWCGPAAIVNAAACWGVPVSQTRAAKLAGTTEEGSDHHDLIRALDALGFAVDELDDETHKRTARQWLERLAGVLPLLLCVDHWGHWVTVVGRCGPRVLVADGFGARGPEVVRPVTIARLMRRWKSARRQGGGAFYGLAIWR